MWDHVRIAETEHTLAAGIAGLDGVVHGFTTPSMTRVDTVGPTPDDFAFNVYVESIDCDFWLDPFAVEFVSRPAEITMVVGTETITYANDGEMEYYPDPASKPWWKFW